MSGRTLFMLSLLLLVLSGYFLRNWCDGSKLRKYILCLVNKRDARWFDYQFLNCTQEQLFYPLNEAQLLTLRTCQKLTVNQAEVIPLCNISRLWRITPFRILYDLSGIDTTGNPFSIREEGCLKVTILFDRSLHSPIITEIVGSRSPF